MMQWTFAAPSQPRFRVYQWTHPTRGAACRYVGVVLFGRELRWWTIDPTPTEHPEAAKGGGQ